jgi:hypothetical protein
MPKFTKSEALAIPGASDVNLLAWLATCVSVFAFLFYYRVGGVLLYGDAIAHINIARRVFDSRTPGVLQLGTVWLPLPHLLMIPFIVSTKMWQTGAGGSIPSMAGFVFAVIGIFRLTRSALTGNEPDRYARFAAWTAAVVFAANPNLIYMQSTAMGETLYLAFFVWAVAFFTEWIRGSNSLTKCALCIAAGCLTRYDGWFLSAAMMIAVIAISLRRHRGNSHLNEGQKRGNAMLPGRARDKEARAILTFLLIAAAAPALWLGYNSIVYRNPLEFANGPYSAKAIEKRTQTTGNPGHPGSGNPAVAALFFLKSAEDNIAQNHWLQRAWMLLGLTALLVITIRGRQSVSAASLKSTIRRASLARTAEGGCPYMGPSVLGLLFLLVPLPFYGLSIAYGGVPIFIPDWWPFTHYNTRYGLQLLPALAVAIAILVYFVLRAAGLSSRVRLASVLIVFAVVAVSYGSIWLSTPICLKEAQVNMRTRNQLQREVARWIEKLPADSSLLIYVGDHVGALERAAFPLKRTINEGNHRVWKQPADAEGLWERALADPAKYVDYVLAFEGDSVWQAVHDKHLHELIELHITGQPRAVLYAAR